MASHDSRHSSDYGSDIDIDIDIDIAGVDRALPGATAILESDYGSDIDIADEAILGLLDLPAPSPPSPLYPSLDFLTLPSPLYPSLDALAQDLAPAVPKPMAVVVKTRTRFARNGTLVIEYDELAQLPDVPEPLLTAVELPGPPASVLTTVSDAQPEADPSDTIPPPGSPRSPYERFRMRRGQLSVTDLVSGVWCEQQFQYTLERGFKRTTPAMAKGTKLHKVLEDEVHTTVPVELTTAEDLFGLKLFNISQGLLSLEEQGMTRELDVFGFLGGIFVQGVIDEITYENPDPEPEPELTPSGSRTAYITDTKTRSSRSLPRGSQLRATALQLMLYHRLLSLLPSVPFDAVLAHRSLDGAAPLSDRFVAQIASIPSAIALDDLLAANSLRGLWALVRRQLRQSIPAVGDTVGVVYRAQSDGEVMARQAWGVDGAGLEAHLQRTLRWWRGERASVGVQIEDAWKCRICEFEESCAWRLSQAARLAQNVRRRKEGSDEERGRSGGKKVKVASDDDSKKRGKSADGPEKGKKPRSRSKRKAAPETDSDTPREAETPKTSPKRGRSKSKKDTKPDA